MSLCSGCHKLACLPYLIFKFDASDWQCRTYVFIRAILFGIFEEKFTSNWNTMNHWAYSIIGVHRGTLRLFSDVWEPLVQSQGNGGQGWRKLLLPQFRKFPHSKRVVKPVRPQWRSVKFFLTYLSPICLEEVRTVQPVDSHQISYSDWSV